MPTTFTGTLNANEIFGALYNMIISQQVYSGFLAGLEGTLAEANKVDGSLYGDTKLYYASDVQESHPWMNDLEAPNLLNITRPNAPAVQKITLDIFRQIEITTDQYLSKRAWSSEGSFAEFISVTLGWMRDTKRVYDITLMNVYVGTTITAVGEQSQTINVTTPTTGLTGEELAKIRALVIGKSIADVLTNLQDCRRDYNDYQYMRAYSLDQLMLVWNSKYYNEFRYMDLPTVFHKDGVLSESKIKQMELNARYFGDPIASKVAQASNDGSYSSSIEADYATGANAACTHVFPGDLIPSGTVKVLTKTKVAGVWTAVTVMAATDAISVGEAYKVNDDYICKIIKKTEAVPFMSAFETETTFFNPKSLTENHYLTWGHNTLEYLANYPFITFEES